MRANPTIARMAGSYGAVLLADAEIRENSAQQIV